MFKALVRHFLRAFWMLFLVHVCGIFEAVVVHVLVCFCCIFGAFLLHLWGIFVPFSVHYLGHVLVRFWCIFSGIFGAF